MSADNCPEIAKTNSTATLGPNVRRLIAERASQLMVEAAKAKHGSAGVGEIAQGILDGTMQQCLREATAWVRSALKVARQATGAEQRPTDEDMAGEILRQIEVRKKRS